MNTQTIETIKATVGVILMAAAILCWFALYADSNYNGQWTCDGHYVARTGVCHE